MCGAIGTGTCTTPVIAEAGLHRVPRHSLHRASRSVHTPRGVTACKPDGGARASAG